MREANEMKIIFEKKFYLIIAFYILLFSGIAIAEKFDPSIFGHNSEEVDGLTWNRNVGNLIYSENILEGGHSSSELDGIVWFNESGYFGRETHAGIFLKQNASSQVSAVIIVIPDTGYKSIQYNIWGGTRFLSQFNGKIDHTLWMDVYLTDFNNDVFSITAKNVTIDPKNTSILSLATYFSDVSGKRYKYVITSLYNPINPGLKLRNSKKSTMWIDCWEYDGLNNPIGLINRQEANEAWLDT
jgi:hypothetical protein